MNLAIDAEIPSVQHEHRRSRVLARGFIESGRLVHVLAIGSVDDSSVRLIRDINSDKVFFSSPAPEKCQHALWSSVCYPLRLTLLQRRMRFSECDELLIKREKFDRRSAIGQKTGSFSNSAGAPDSVVSPTSIPL